MAVTASDVKPEKTAVNWRRKRARRFAVGLAVIQAFAPHPLGTQQIPPGEECDVSSAENRPL